MIFRNTKSLCSHLLRPVLATALPAVAGLALGGAVAPAFAAQPRTGSAHPGPHWAHVAAGLDHTCGITTSGTLWCWGGNDHGQLGIGSKTNQNLPRPVTTPRQYGWVSVATGTNRSCAIRTDHTLWCWGENGNGQLGIGPGLNQSLPQQVTGCRQLAARPSARRHQRTTLISKLAAAS